MGREATKENSSVCQGEQETKREERTEILVTVLRKQTPWSTNPPPACQLSPPSQIVAEQPLLIT